MRKRCIRTEESLWSRWRNGFWNSLWAKLTGCKMNRMANLTLIYGLRLLPEGEVTEVKDAILKLANGHEARVTMHVLEGSRDEIERQLKMSLDAFFDFYPEI